MREKSSLPRFKRASLWLSVRIAPKILVGRPAPRAPAAAEHKRQRRAVSWLHSYTMPAARQEEAHRQSASGANQQVKKRRRRRVGVAW